MSGILEDAKKPPLERLRVLVRVFIRSECDEAQMRVALDDAAPLYRDAPEAQEAKSSADGALAMYLEEVLPAVPEATRVLVGDLISTTLSSAGKSFSESQRTEGEIEAFAAAMGEMFCAYLRSLGG